MKTLHGLFQNQLKLEILNFQLYLIYFLLKRLLHCFFFFFLVIFNNVLTTPVVTVNIKVKDAPAIPTGIPTIVAYEAIHKVPKDADSVIKTLHNQKQQCIY